MYLALESEFQDYSTTDDIDLVNNIFKDAMYCQFYKKNYTRVYFFLNQTLLYVSDKSADCGLPNPSLLNVTFFS